MELRFFKHLEFKNPSMVAAWPGMGYLAKTSVDFLRRQLKAEPFAEILQYQNAVIYKDGVVDLPIVRHRFYSNVKGDVVLCIGDGQPRIPEEAYRIASMVIDVAERCNVKRVYTLAAFPDDFYEAPRVFGIATSEDLSVSLEEHGIEMAEDEGVVNGLNGLLIGLAKTRGIEGICLLGQIRYVNVPQIRSSKAVLDALIGLLDFKIDTTRLELRAEKIEERIKSKIERHQKKIKKEEKDIKKLNYIS